MSRLHLPRWFWIAFCLLALSGGGLFGVRFANRVCNEPLDVSGTMDIPSWIEQVKNRDEVAYPAHVAMGTVLTSARCRPSAIGMQWFKAASHARNEGELTVAANGMRDAWLADDSYREVHDELCRAVATGRVRPRQITALERAGLRCPPATPHQ